MWGTDVTGTLTLNSAVTSPVTNNSVTFTWSSANVAINGGNSSGFKANSNMTITLPAGATLTGIAKTNGNGWGSGATIYVYAGSDNTGTLIASIVTGTNSYTINSNNTGGTYYFENSTSKNAWIKSLSITYTPGDGPMVTANPSSINAAYTAINDGAIALSYSKISVTSVSVGVYSNSACTSEFTGDWINVPNNLSTPFTSLPYSLSANTGIQRTAYIKISATGSEDKSASTIIPVTQAAFTPISSISIDETASIYLENTKKLTATISPASATNKTLLWSSNNESVATVSSTGIVTAVGVGEANIRADAQDGSGQSATCTVTVAYQPSIVLDFTDNTDWSFPEGSSNIKTSTSNYTNGITITLSGGGTGNGHYWNTTGSYLLMGKSGAYLQLPAFDFDVTKIVVTGKGGASTAVKQNIFVGDEEASTETTGATGVNTYEIASEYQQAGNIYKLQVTSNHNAQITKIEIFGKVVAKVNKTAKYITYHNYNFAYIMPTGLEGIIIKNIQGTALEKETVYTAGDVVPAHEPLLIHSTESLDSDKDYTLTLTNTSNSANSNNKLKGLSSSGLTTGGSGEDKYYHLTWDGTDASTLGFYYGAAEGNAFTINSDKAYLIVSSAGILLAPSHFLIEDEVNNATIIQKIAESEKAVKFIQSGKILIMRDGVVYDALGRIVR